MPTRERKGVFYEKLYKLLETHDSLLIVSIDNVGSFQLAQIRKALRKDELATILMGKNTLMRKVIAAFVAANPDHPIAAVSEHLRGNVGFVFVRKDMAKVRELIAAEKKGAPAKVGSVAENDVEIPAGPTGCDPGQTSFFQALSVPTKISKGQIEIVSALRLIKKGDKVGPSEAALLQKLNILPFSYGVKFLSVYMNGSVFPADVLDISEDVVRRKFVSGTRFLAAFSLGVGIPTAASLPHSLGRAARDALALAAVTGYTSKFTAKWDKLFSLSPEELAKLSSGAASSSSGGAAEAKTGAGKAEAKPEAKAEEAGDALEGGLFPTGGSGGKY